MSAKVTLSLKGQEIDFVKAFTLPELDFLNLDIQITDPYDKDSPLRFLEKALRKALLLTYKVNSIRQPAICLSEQEYQFIFALLTKRNLSSGMSWDYFYFKEHQICFNYACEDHKIGEVRDTMSYELYNLLVSIDSISLFYYGVKQYLSDYEINERNTSYSVQKQNRDKFFQSKQTRQTLDRHKIESLKNNYLICKALIVALSLALISVLWL